MKSGLMLEALGLTAQAVSFVVGLVLSLMLGMFLAAQLSGPGGLLLATVISGAGLLGAAVGSQSLRDWVVRSQSDSP